MRFMVLIASAFAALMLVPRTAEAFETEAVKSDPVNTARLSDLNKPLATLDLQGLGQSDSAHFSDSDGTDQPGTMKLLGGTLQVYGNVNQPTENGNVNIPGSLPSSDFVPFSSPYLRPSH